MVSTFTTKISSSSISNTIKGAMFVCGVMITGAPPGGPGIWGTIKYSFDGSTYYTWPTLQSASL